MSGGHWLVRTGSLIAVWLSVVVDPVAFLAGFDLGWDAIVHGSGRALGTGHPFSLSVPLGPNNVEEGSS